MAALLSSRADLTVLHRDSLMQTSVFGIGHVGAVSAACLANDGHKVIAVDSDARKVETLNAGASPIAEPGLEGLIQDGIRSKRLKATSDVRKAVQGSDISFVCVGTPSRPNGSLDKGYVTEAAEEIGTAIREKNSFHAVVVRSTILPGTTESIVLPALERTSGRQAGVGFGLAYYPAFLRESTAVADYYNPSAIVFGRHDQTTIDHLLELHKIFRIAPRIVPIRTAEAVKYVNHAWHAVRTRAITSFLGEGAASSTKRMAVLNDCAVRVKSAHAQHNGYYGD